MDVLTRPNFDKSPSVPVDHLCIHASAGPAGPGGPAGPVGPVWPVAPVGPAMPWAPVGPVIPCGPVRPAGGPGLRRDPRDRQLREVLQGLLGQCSQRARLPTAVKERLQVHDCERQIVLPLALSFKPRAQCPFGYERMGSFLRWEATPSSLYDVPANCTQPPGCPQGTPLNMSSGRFPPEQREVYLGLVGDKIPHYTGRRP